MMRRVAPLVLLVFASAAWAGDALDDATKAFEAGDFKRAAELAGAIEAKQDNPVRAQAMYLAGEAKLALRDAAGAEECFRDALRTKKDSVPALTGLGRALTVRAATDAKAADEAEKTLRRAVELDAKSQPARRALGSLLSVLSKHDAARKELEAARKLDPKDALTAQALVDACLRAEEVDAAGKFAAWFRKDAGETAMGHFLEALVLDRKGEADAAIACYEKAVAKDDRFIDAHKNLAILRVARNPMYRDAAKLEKAYAHIDRYFELGGDDPKLKETFDTIRRVLEEYGMGPKKK
ncbi:MAG: hypothetical protein HMLKMBBP_00155 [Planctomycetes bacterium]|nr:hypothetical protein [Planctomycetota bacterium]